ncbi:hypothetical protein QLS91_08210 [Flavobacterium sp. LB2P84]|uniref:hypothetical protein n=1 Tax=Flavobacterium yafengii TaxID=3041253 RepID=UPI0024A81957|nr:hypothetical protein [Flavobacterium yafengii]MDI6033056.1 hypothetical protein [Flavobacterium yafengii]
MIYSANPEPHKDEFNSLLSSTLLQLNYTAKTANNFVSLAGNKLEPYISKLMTELAVGTPFESSIEWVGGQKFPDIIAKKYYGIEVKTTTQNHWKTTGNSVLESSRVNDVERIYMLFAKLASPIEFKCRPYEECLSEVVVTHSPRYLIDMNLGPGKTIFDKMSVQYDDLRNKENPIRPIIDYYRSKLKPGQDIWWMDQENGSSSSMIIKLWSDLSPKNKGKLVNEARIYFPELFGKSPKKYGRLGIWLINRENIICPNMRDPFSAGGNALSYKFNDKTYEKVPKKIVNLFENLHEIVKLFSEISAKELSEYWKIKTTEDKKIFDWIEMVSQYSKTVTSSQHLDLKTILTAAIFK